MQIKEYLRQLSMAVRGKASIASAPIAAAVGDDGWSWGRPVAEAVGSTADFYKLSVAVYACIKLRADNLAAPPLRVFQSRPDGPQPVLDTHPLQQLMQRVNPFWSRHRFWQATETDLCLWGSAFWALERRGRRLPQEMWRLRPDRVSVIPDKVKYIRGYVYRDGLTEIAFNPDEVIWLRYHNPYDEFSGLSPLEAARLSVEANTDALQWNRRFFQNDATPGRVYLQAKEMLTSEQASELQRRWASLHKGPDQAHRIAILDSATELKTIGISQRDMEFLALQRFTLEDICRVYQVPPPMVADLERATYSNMREAKASFWHETMLPELAFIAGEVNEFLAPMFGPDLFVDFDVSDIEALKQDENAKVSRYVQLASSGIMTVNEIRAAENLEPVEWGDVWWSPLGLLPADMGRGIPVVTELTLPPSEVVSRNTGNGYSPIASTSMVYPRATHSPETLVTHGAIAVMPDAALDRWWDVRVKRLDAKETIFARAIRPFFLLQEENVLNRLQGGRKARLDLFDPDEWVEVLNTLIRPAYAVIMAESATEVIADFGFAVAWDLRNPRVQRWLGAKVAEFSKDINTVTSNAISEQLRLGEAEGESIGQLSDRIRSVFAQASTRRAEVIARTETVSASVRANLEVYRQAGVQKKQWFTARDHRVRGNDPADQFDHVVAHGQIRNLDEPFEVSGEMLDGPGDSTRGASPGNIIQCRCDALPIVEG